MQRKYRIRRLDSKHDKIFIYNLIAKNTIDIDMRKKLDEKTASFTGTIENTSAQTEMHQGLIKKPDKPKRKRKKKRIKDDDLW